ncbi:MULTISPECIES: TetR/AcrR family transcriptional regulator [unclassified Nocardia]|uniref:TetR/AcrR family transcriptional regulator n=1 Tax=unclassified Nocardia TaxID=2637762 RepID=UPI001CE45428|nr:MULTISPECIES: TetR/AcrR family transcriptional regulator [unclassified Nocardia]
MTAKHGDGIRAKQRQDTQRRILAAARQLFAEVGYDRATIRAIAAAAGTDPGLVMRYYGTKRQLFEQVADMPVDDIVRGTPDEVAEAILAALSAKLTTEPTATLASLRSLLTHPEAAEHANTAIAHQEQQLAVTIGGDDAAIRAGLVGAITLGTVIARHMLRLNGLRQAPPDRIIELLRPHIHALLEPGRP